MHLNRAFCLTVTVLFGSTLVSDSSAASLAYSTYLRAGFTPKALISDAQGNLYLAGKAVTDPISGTTSAAVAKLDAHASGFQYFAFLDSTSSDDLRAIAVDNAGNVYVTGATVNPAFPATGGKLATPSTGPSDPRSFVSKLSPTGAVVFSVLVGGSASSTAKAIALTPQGQIVISGMSASSSFPVTSGAYAVSDSKQHPFLMELDAAASTVVFSATGIGGTSIALDSSGNIYVSGSTTELDYPTTPGAYQTTFTPAFTCSGLCQVGNPGGQQYLSKVNPTGSQLIYSTGVNGSMAYRSASTQNTGLAVDASGNAYLTGVLDGGVYPFTTAIPSNSPYEFGFLTKLDPTGATVLYSIPIGGGGVQIDSSGALYAAGVVTNYNPGVHPPVTPVAMPAPLAWVPSQCLPDNITANSEVYVMKLDPASGTVVDTQWIDGSALGAVTLVLGSGRAWVTGATQLADVPITPGALLPANLGPGIMPGTYLSSVDFSQAGVPVNGLPQLGCVVDGGNLMHAGPVAANQLLTLFGANLGPADGLARPDGTTSAAGVRVSFDGNPAQLLYVSASQINVVVPASVGYGGVTVMQVSVNGVTANLRQLPVTRSNPNLLASVSGVEFNCARANQITPGFFPVAANADGSLNSCANPAKLGSIVSFYIHGISSPICACFDATLGVQSAAVVKVVTVNTFITRVDVQMPSSFATGTLQIPAFAEGYFQLSLSMYNVPVGPLGLPRINITGPSSSAPGLPFPMFVWATQ